MEAEAEPIEPIVTARIELDGRRVALVSDPDRGAVESIGVEVPLALELPRDADRLPLGRDTHGRAPAPGHFEIADDLSATSSLSA